MASPGGRFPDLAPSGPQTPFFPRRRCHRAPPRGVDVKATPGRAPEPQFLTPFEDFGQKWGFGGFCPGSYRGFFRENGQKWPFWAKRAKNGVFGRNSPFWAILGLFGPSGASPGRGFYINPSRRGPAPWRRPTPRGRGRAHRTGRPSPQRRRQQALAASCRGRLRVKVSVSHNREGKHSLMIEA